MPNPEVNGWQQALIEGVTNMYIDASGEPVGGEPFDGAAHQAWLFGTIAGLPYLMSEDYREVQAAIRNVPRKGTGSGWEVAPDDQQATDIVNLIREMVDCGALTRASAAPPQVFYMLVHHKLDHVKEHGKLDMARAIYAGVPDDCKEAVVRFGSREYYGVSDDTKMADFLALLTAPSPVTFFNNHDW